MQLNPFIWNNYKQTEQGKNAIADFSSNNSEAIFSKYSNVPYINKAALGLLNDLLDYAVSPTLPEQLDFEEALKIFAKIGNEGVQLSYNSEEAELIDPKYNNILQLTPIISTWLYLNYPDIFKPYFFRNNFDLLTKIADTFGIDLPPVPLKRYKEQRLLYYIEICKAFAEFQLNNQLSAQEFCAFLYDFAPAYLKQTSATAKGNLPEPTQVWWIGGDKGGGDFEFLDGDEPERTSFWQGAEDTRKGDILVMYCLSPRSYIHSIWRATRDGIADPFFHYYSNIYIGHGQKIPPVSIHELKADPHFSQNPLVRKNLQGINGYPLSSADYERLQEMFREKGFDISRLPKLYSHSFELNEDLKTERDVELALIEPLLKRVGFMPEDWVRQLSVRMGRGERNFPDYAFLTDKTPGFEKASMLIESKFWIKNNRELEETFKQVWSYGQRLNANKLIIADKDAIWIYDKKQDSFDRTQYLKIFWKQLENPDIFSQMVKALGRR